MALPVIAGVSIVAIISAIAQFVQAIFATVNTALQAVVQWFAAHKIIFALFLLGVWIALWAGVAGLVMAVSRWAYGVSLGGSPDYEPLREVISYVNFYVPVRRIGYTISLVLALFSAEVLIRNTRWGLLTARKFLQGVSQMFHG